MRAQRLQQAIDILESGTLSNPTGLVQLQSPLCVKLKPRETIELRGPIPHSNISIVPRETDQLPQGLAIVSTEVFSDSISCKVANSSGSEVVLSHSVVLAEIHSPNSEPLEFQALVGPSTEAPIKIDSRDTTCLIDSGSQVSTISESFFSKYVTDDLYDLPHDFKLLGAGDNEIPYLGYTRASVFVPSEFVGVGETVESIFLVCPDTKFSSRVPILLGTNTLSLFANMCKRVAGPNYARVLELKAEVAFAYEDMVGDNDGYLGSARLMTHHVIVQPGAVEEVPCLARISAPVTRDAIVLSESKSLAEGLAVVGCKVPTQFLPKVKVFVRNETDKDIMIKKGQKVADVFTIDTEYTLNNVCNTLLQNGDQQGHNDGVAHMFQCSAQSSCADEVKKDTNVEIGCDDKQTTDKIQFKFGDAAPSEWKTKFDERLQGYSDVFVKHSFDINAAETGHEYDIKLEPGPTVRNRARPVNPKDFEDFRRHIQGLLDAKIIRPSNSPFASGVVLCRKKNGDLRVTCDYRMINARTVKDSYCVPKIDDLFLTLSGSKWYSSCDLCKAYFQLPISESSKKITAFATPFGVYEWNRLSQGLCNAPAVFQRVMEGCFRDMNLTELIIFLDDLLIHGKTLEELEERTIKVLERLRKFKLKLDPAKCVFGTAEVKHLGHVISENSIRPDPDKTSAVDSWPKPATVKEVKSFLGFCNMYRKFIPQFHTMSKPLNELTLGYVPAKCRSRSKKEGATLTLSSDITHLWNDKHDTAFTDLKHALTSDLVLGIADKERPFFLHVDASGFALGAVLYQNDPEGKMRVIAYASRGLNKSEQHYPAHKREFLALKWAMSDKFRDFLLGSKSVVVTDNNPLCYVLKNAKLDATCHRWLASLSLFDFELRYKKGSLHTDADALSRRAHEHIADDDAYKRTMEKIAFLVEKAERFDDITAVSSDSVQAVLNSQRVGYSLLQRTGIFGTGGPNDGDSVPAVEQIVKDPSLIPDDVLEPKSDASVQDVISDGEWRKLQLDDENLRSVIQCLEGGQLLSPVQLGNPELKVFSREWKHLVLRGGVLKRQVEHDGLTQFQLVIPKSYRKTALRGVHDDLFHTHFDDAVIHLRRRFFWPFMARHLEEKIKTCSRCIRKGARCQKAPMQSIVTTYPLELLSIDYLTIEVKGIKQNVLMVLDHFTKFASAILTKDQTAKTVAKALWEKFFMTYGFPKRILSDQGRDFESKMIKELCDVAGITKCRTTPYHPSGNPVERTNRTLIGMLRGLENEQKTDWRKSLPAVVHAYNCCISQSTGFSPYFLFFGRQPRLPIDVAFGIDIGEKKKGSTIQYVRELKSQLGRAYQKASDNMEKSSNRNKRRYDASAIAAELCSGDRVLVRKLGPRLDSKVSDRWEDSIYIVKARAGELPVYTVQDESGKGPLRTLHRNHLLPIGILDMENSQTQQKSVAPPKPVEGIKARDVDLNLVSSSDSGDDIFIDVEVVPVLPVPVEAAHEEKVLTDSQVEKVVDVNVPEARECGEDAQADELSDRGEHASGDNPDSEGDMPLSSQSEVSVESSDGDMSVESSEPRRSTRIRRPVDRLNLLHRVQCRRGVTPRSNVDPVCLELRRLQQQVSVLFGLLSVGVGIFVFQLLWFTF